jgi:glycosyltransferase involved in cell wall biosynthesis
VMVSKATQRQFATELGVDESLFTVVPNGVPPSDGDPGRVRAEFGIDERDCVLLAVGTLERHKGHQILLEALARVVATGPGTPWRLIVAGGRGGDQHQSLLNYIREMKLEHRVSIVTNRNDIPDLLALADVFVMPSLFEGLPMALLEAMLARKAIIASRTAGIPEAIAHGREGLLVAPSDVDGLAEALRNLLMNPDRRAELGQAAYVRAEREFTVRFMAERYETLYSNAWSSRHTSSRGAVASPFRFSGSQ